MSAPSKRRNECHIYTANKNEFFECYTTVQVFTMNSDIYWFVHRLKTVATSSFGNEFSDM